MKPYDNPSNDIYVTPRDCNASSMHYAVVRVSSLRYVVVEYDGLTPTNNNLPSFITVSEPRPYGTACALADQLTNARINKE